MDPLRYANDGKMENSLVWEMFTKKRLVFEKCSFAAVEIGLVTGLKYDDPCDFEDSRVL